MSFFEYYVANIKPYLTYYVARGKLLIIVTVISNVDTVIQVYTLNCNHTLLYFDHHSTQSKTVKQLDVVFNTSAIHLLGFQHAVVEKVEEPSGHASRHQTKILDIHFYI